MADLLLELFSEEIPARMQAKAEFDLAQPLFHGLFEAFPTWNRQGNSHFIAPSEYTIYSTPRRVAIIIRNIPTTQDDISTEVKGPKVDAPEAALQGFLKKNNLTLDQLENRDGVYFATTQQKGKPTAEVLKGLIEARLASFPWPKSMRWGSRDESWVRPLQSILCLFDGKVVPVEFSGIKAGNTTRGHRFLSSGDITVSNVADYEAALKKAHVLASREARKAEILAQAEAAAKASGVSLKKDEGLLEEVTGLVEWPTVLVGSIDDKFMDLPKEVLVSEMRAHQKYFALENADGSLSRSFLITSNMVASDGGKAIIAGNERVLRARLSDGRFFWDMDRKKSLADWAQNLKVVTYHAKLGTVADKVSRIVTLAESFAAIIPGADVNLVRQAASLCKADLVTGMVGEFPELQGVMGRYYALAQGEKQQVADAIRDHYKPQGPGDSVPSEPTAICVALADKFDTLISMFNIGEKPTGSKDPFALRRAALGIIRIILENNIRIGLKLLNNPDLLAFFGERLKVQLKEQNVRHDVISAVLADGDDDFVRVVARAKALGDFIASEDGANLITAYRRAANILTIEEKKDKVTYEAAQLQVSGLKEAEEKQLADTLASTAAAIRLLLPKEDYAKAMKALANLRAPVDQFFDKIMVNTDDQTLRANRLRLLAQIRAGMDSIANFAVIEG